MTRDNLSGHPGQPVRDSGTGQPPPLGGSVPVSQASDDVCPRLVNMKGGARYLGVSEWTARDWALQGLFPVVNLPPRRPREGDRPKRTFRRLLVDVRDLDTFIETRKRRLTE